MLTETPGKASCPGSAVCRNVVFVTLLVLLAITATGWVVTATRERPVHAAVPPAVTPEPTRPAAPLPALPVEPPTSEVVEALVAAKDLPIGTVFTRDELKHAVKLKKFAKDSLPNAYVANVEDLMDKRLSRAVRAEEPFNTRDIVKPGLVMLPEGYDMVSIAMTPPQAAGGFIGPGCRVNILATWQHNNKLYAFKLLVNVLVLAVDSHVTGEKQAFPAMSTVSLAVTEKEAIVLALAKGRGCKLELLLRNPNQTYQGDADYSIDDVIKLLVNEKENPAPGEGEGPRKEPAVETPEIAPLPREGNELPEVAPLPRVVGER